MLQTLSRPMSLTRSSSSAPGRSIFSALNVNLSEIFDVLLLMLIALGGSIPIIIPAAGTVDVNATSQSFRAYYNVMLGLMLLAFALAAMRNRFRIPFRLGSARFAFLFVAYGVVSIFWSVTPLSRSAPAATLLIGTLFYTAYLHMHYSRRRLALILCCCFTVLAVTSLLLVIFLPQYGIDQTGNAGAWQGAFIQKNALGTAMVLSLVCGLTMPAGHRPWKYLLIGVSLVVLAGSRSRESWVAAVACVLALGLLRFVLRFRKSDRGLIIAAVLIIAAASGLWAGSHLNDILRLMGRDATFSGRTKIWEAVIILIEQRPLLGYGIAGVGAPIWSFVDMYSKFKTGPDSTHNIYLDGLLRYGIIGTSILAGAFLLGVWHTFKAMIRSTTGRVEFPILALVGILVCGLAGHLLFALPNIQMPLLFLALFQLNCEATTSHSLRS
jgi:exopolysaccharide production protein ExoQ